MSKIKKVLIHYDDKTVGTIALTNDMLCAFQYDKQWIKEGFSISPFELPLNDNLFVAKKNPFDGNFGVFDDSLPDGWGMLILDRYLKSIGINPQDVSVLDLMAYVGSSGRGALSFNPDYSSASYDNYNLLQIESEINDILSTNDYQGSSIENLWKRGGSPGGARPKVNINFNGCEWLVKFPAKYDNSDIGIIEYKYSLLAKKCDVKMSETALFENRFFGTKRFDRKDDGTRLHTVTAAGLLGADYGLPSLDYLQLMKLTALLTNEESELWKMYRLMCFNYLIENKDDHAKNFSFIYKDGSWKMSPAYDLLPSYGFNGYHTTSFDGDITPSEKSIMRIAIKSGLEEKKAKRVFSDMKTIIKETKITDISE